MIKTIYKSQPSYIQIFLVVHLLVLTRNEKYYWCEPLNRRKGYLETIFNSWIQTILIM